ncbi:MAG: trehalose-phosphatase [Candidatus Omnitrophota bacterium]
MKGRKKRKHLIDAREKIKEKIKNKHVYLFLDFDGTLSAIRRNPSEVKLSRAKFKILKKISEKKDITTAIISGRALKEIKNLVGIKNLIYAGNHGMEMGRSRGKGNKKTKVIGKILQKKLEKIKGVLVEDKGATLSAHFRMAARGKEKEVIRIIKEITLPYEKAGDIRVTQGKKVFEIRPPFAWDKGRCVEHLLREKRKTLKRRVSAFYLGDDETDEDVFKRLKKRIFCVKVGKPEGKGTSANYYLNGVQEVGRFLKKLCELLV